MAKIPKDFKFEDNKLIIKIEANGTPDGETIKNKTEVDAHCDAQFMYTVIRNFIDKDDDTAKMFKEAVMDALQDELFSNLKAN